MKLRLNAEKAAPGPVKALLELSNATRRGSIEGELLHLVDLRASQLNGCAYCINMHWKEAREAGASEQKLSLVSVWRTVPFFSERERAALEWTEALTFIHQGHVPDDVYRVAREQFSEQELATLTLAIGAINAWNRIAISFRAEATLQAAAAA